MTSLNAVKRSRIQAAFDGVAPEEWVFLRRVPFLAEKSLAAAVAAKFIEPHPEDIGIAARYYYRMRYRLVDRQIDLGDLWIE